VAEYSTNVAELSVATADKQLKAVLIKPADLQLYVRF
jgi:hypothetical protein